MAQPHVFRGGGHDLPWLTALCPGRRSPKVRQISGERRLEPFSGLRFLIRFHGSERARTPIASVKTTHNAKAKRHKPREVVSVVVDWHLARWAPLPWRTGSRPLRPERAMSFHVKSQSSWTRRPVLSRSRTTA